MLIEKVRSDLHKATKDRDKVRVGALRMLVSALEYLEKQGGEVSEADELAVVKSEVKKRREAMDAYTKAGDSERAKSEKAESEIISVYMPEQASEKQVKVVVEKLVGEMGSDVNRGQLIGRVIGEMGRERIDGAIVSRVVNEVLG